MLSRGAPRDAHGPATRAPHWYIIAGKTPGIDYDDFIRAGRMIRRYREPSKFYRVTRLYSFSHDRQLQFWVGWSKDDEATLINMARTDRVYGPKEDFDLDRVPELRLPRRRLEAISKIRSSQISVPAVLATPSQ